MYPKYSEPAHYYPHHLRFECQLLNGYLFTSKITG